MNAADGPLVGKIAHGFNRRRSLRGSTAPFNANGTLAYGYGIAMPAILSVDAQGRPKNIGLSFWMPPWRQRELGESRITPPIDWLTVVG